MRDAVGHHACAAVRWARSGRTAARGGARPRPARARPGASSRPPAACGGATFRASPPGARCGTARGSRRPPTPPQGAALRARRRAPTRAPAEGRRPASNRGESSAEAGLSPEAAVAAPATRPRRAYSIGTRAGRGPCKRYWEEWSAAIPLTTVNRRWVEYAPGCRAPVPTCGRKSALPTSTSGLARGQPEQPSKERAAPALARPALMQHPPVLAAGHPWRDVRVFVDRAVSHTAAPVSVYGAAVLPDLSGLNLGRARAGACRRRARTRRTGARRPTGPPSRPRWPPA